MATAAAFSTSHRKTVSPVPAAALTQSARVTVLMTPDKKVEIETEAARLGVSSGEYIRLAVDRFDAAEEEEVLRAVVDEANAVIPRMIASLDNSIASLEAAHQEVDEVLRKLGVRA